MNREVIERLLQDLLLLRDSMRDDATGVSQLDINRAEWLANILAHSPDIISVLDLEGRILYVSRTVPGVDRVQFIGRRAREFIQAGRQAEWDRAIERAVATGEPQHAELLGVWDFWWETRIVPIQNNNEVTWILSIATDVTARKRAEAVLAERDHQLKLALEASGMGQWSWEIERDRITWDAAAKRIFAWPEENDDIDFAAFIGRVHHNDCDRIKASLHRAISTGELPDLEFRTTSSDGSVRWVLGKGRVVRGDDGEAHQLIGGFVEITNGKRTSEQLQRSQKLEAIGQLAGGIAHDFNNLLVAILGNLSLALETSEDRERTTLIEDAINASNRAAELTRQLLVFSRRTPVNQALVDLNATLTDTLKLLRRVLPESIEIDFIPGHRLPRIMADRGQLEQVFVNLCVNARDAMPQGGRLSIETETVLINGRFRDTHPWARPGRYVLTSVTDTGIGIPGDALDRIFEPFFSTKPQGTGLGLATAYGTVRQHGGFLHVYSEPGKGTTFKVYLPIADRDASDVGTKVEDAVTGGTETILIAEDEPRVRQVVVRILERAGYRVIVAEDGEEAVRLFKQHVEKIALVLIDAVMPNKSGHETVSEIRAISPGVAAVLCSGYSDALRGPGASGGDDVSFLAKPYEPDVLLRVVKRQLDARSSK